jgi:serine/threonine-protein kinase
MAQLARPFARECGHELAALPASHMVPSARRTMRPKDRYIGREILDGQFRIIKKIGTGGMGSVYKAEQPDMNRMVAVKILHAKLKNRHDLVSRFRREARAMSHLTHPNTVKVMMYGELETGELYIVMEYLEGRNMNQIVRRQGPLPVERAIPILVQVCGALEEAHELGIIHRDMKPENIFLTNSGGITDFPKVLDFGLAKVTERELRPGSIMLTQEGMVFGTPEFMSPEQAQGLELDRRSDIYSLAVILYEALTGKLPFDARSSMEYIQLHVTKPPISLDERVEGMSFPPGLGAVIAKALAKEANGRFATANDFAEALAAFAPMPAGLPTSLPSGGGLARADVSGQSPAAISGPVAANASGSNAALGSGPGLTTEAATEPAAPGPLAGRADSKTVEITDPPSVDQFPSMATETAPTIEASGGGVTSRTLLIVGAVSLVAGVILTVVVLKLLG